MKKHQEEMLFRTATNSYVEKEDEQIRKEMEEVDDFFKKMAAENREFNKILDREFGGGKKNNISRFSAGYKVAAVLLIVILGFSVSVMTVPALKNAVIDFVNYVTGRYTEVGESSKNNLKDKNINNDFSFDKEYKITYLPTGLVVSDKNITEHKIEYNYISEISSESVLIYSQMKKNVSSNIDTENAITQFVDIDGTDAILSEEDGAITIIFEKNGYNFMLEGIHISRDEMIKIANSIR